MRPHTLTVTIDSGGYARYELACPETGPGPHPCTVLVECPACQAAEDGCECCDDGWVPAPDGGCWAQYAFDVLAPGDMRWEIPTAWTIPVAVRNADGPGDMYPVITLAET